MAKLIYSTAISIIYILIVSTCICESKDSEIITQPQPGQEYVFVQSSVVNSQPKLRKGKKTTPVEDKQPESNFETSHKIPADLSFQPATNLDPLTVDSNTDLLLDLSPRPVRDAKGPSDMPHPAAIKIDPFKLIEMYRPLLEQTTEHRVLLTTTQRNFDVLPINKNKAKGKFEGKSVDSNLSPSGSDNVPHSRIEIKKGPNGQEYEYEYVYYYYDDEDEKKDGDKNNFKDIEDVDAKEIKNTKRTKEEKKTNAHDGPQRNLITPQASKSGAGSKYVTIDRSGSSSNKNSNEIVSSRNDKGKQLKEEPEVAPERLPKQTRFPPRSRESSTTPVTTTEEATTHKPTHQRGRQRGRPQQQASSDSVADESQGSTNSNSLRSRTRANVRRPSLELVDSASFKTHASDVSVSQYKDLPSQEALPEKGSSSQGPHFPTNLPDGPMRFLGATVVEKEEDEPAQVLDGPTPKSAEPEELYSDIDRSTTEDSLTTTLTDEMPAAMQKVALDLYALLQGTQNTIDDRLQTDGTDSSNSISTTEESSSISTTFEPITETTTLEPTTQSTTTSTTAAPTTTTTEPPSSTSGGHTRYGGRKPLVRRKPSTSASSTTESSDSSSTTTKHGRFGNKNGGRNGNKNGYGGRPRSRTTTTTEANVETEVVKNEAKPVSHSRPTTNRRFGSRGRPTTTTTTASSSSVEDSPAEESNSIAPVSSKPTLPRSRPNFNLRRRIGTTTHNVESTTPSVATEDNKESEEKITQSDASSTTSKPVRGRAGGNNLVRPLRPRINIGGRGRPNVLASTTTTPAAPVVNETEDNNESASEEAPNLVDSSDSEKTSETTSASSQISENPLTKLRNRARLNINLNVAKSTSAPVQINRRQNPLLRRKGVTTSTEGTTAAHDVTEAPKEEHNETTDTTVENEKEAAPVSSTAEPEQQPRGLNSLLAGRRRLVNRRPGTIL